VRFKVQDSSVSELLDMTGDASEGLEESLSIRNLKVVRSGVVALLVGRRQ
jgi:hypothetical protein